MVLWENAGSGQTIYEWGGDAVYSIFYRVARSGLDRLADRRMHAQSW